MIESHYQDLGKSSQDPYPMNKKVKLHELVNNSAWAYK